MKDSQSPIATGEEEPPAPLALRACTFCVSSLAIFLTCVSGSLMAIGLMTGFREREDASAMVLLAVVLVASVSVTIVLTRKLARFLRTQSSGAHLLVIVVGLVLSFLLGPAVVVYPT